MWLLPLSPAFPAPLYTDLVSELTADPPNVLIILADDFGNDNVGVYGEAADAPPTPNIDALAGQGVRFRNAYAYPICSPTRAALLTGRLARRTGMGAIVEWNDTFELPLEEVTIPELLDSGPYDYATTAIGKWHLSGPDTPNAFRHPNLQGFDHYAGPIHNLYFEDESQKDKSEGQRSDYYHFDRVVDGELSRSDTYATHQQTDDALEAIRTMPEPWFLYLAYSAVHSPYQAPPDARIPQNAPADVKYDAMVRDMDAQIGRLLEGLKGKRQRTIIVFLGDNGSPKEAITPPFEPKHGKTTIYEGGTNVPLIVAGPGVTARGARADALVHVVDVLPTLARLTGIDPANVGARLDGMSFAEVLRDPAAAGPRKYVYTERMSPAGPPPWTGQWSAVRDERYKLVKSPEGELRFYDLQGRDDDGPARVRSELPEDERARFDALKAELDRVLEKIPYGR